MSDFRPFHWLTFAVLLVCGLTLALPNADAARQDDEHGEQAEHPLGSKMDALQSNVKKLRRALKDPQKKDECIKLIQDAQTAAIGSIQHAPPAPKDLAADKHAGWTIGFKRKMLGLADVLLQLELAVSEGRTEDAGKLLGTAFEMKSDGHDVYQR